LTETYDVAIVGGGVIGCSLARVLSLKKPGLKVAIIEKEKDLALHTSGRNSGVVHSGFHPKPGSLKARLCVEGNRMIREFAKMRNVPISQVGTLVVARNEGELKMLSHFKNRAEANLVPGVTILGAQEMRKLENNVEGLAALHSPTGCIIDSKALVQSVAEDAVRNGAKLLLGWRLLAVKETTEGLILRTSEGEVSSRLLVNCGGLYADTIAHMLGAGMKYVIIPFRGEYYQTVPDKRSIVGSMVYPTPDPDLPFLGIHFTKTVHGSVIVGPNAVLAAGREAYGAFQFNFKEFLSTITETRFIKLITDPEFISLATRQLRTSLSKSAFVAEARTLVPSLREDDLTRGFSGIRAQLVDEKGRLVDDFVIDYTAHSVHILNAVSPGLTCSLAFGDYLVDVLTEKGYIPS